MRTSSSTDFSAELADQTARAQAQADLERDMTELADTQLRYEADARLLHDAYARLRTAVRERALASRRSRSRRVRCAS